MSAATHIPVMAREVVSALAPRENGVYVDATFGAGGYARAILMAANCIVYGFDRDPTAIDRAKAMVAEFGDRLRLINRPFAEMEEALAERGVDGVDGVVFDLGVSSMQLDEAERGFSFRREGPLSMRMDGGKPDAGDVIAKGDARELAAIFRTYGEEKRAGRIARAIVNAREIAPITTTTALASIVEKAAPNWGKSKTHPATRVFQALRIFVNDELGQLVAGLRAAERMLRPAGRVLVVTFHSLEDRIVKRFFANRFPLRAAGSRHAPPAVKAAPTFEPIFAKALAPGDEETLANTRARSARLRGGVRLAAPFAPLSDERLGLPSPITLKNFNEGKR
ncbi:MAG: 16S rRNA (cytosine(1402)-N(4))-methyltransferase RsmH [Alphaproteobacteria bacterium]|nr:16S rRNA (cytosine(1402)-N(4))-methyltransferase RsmH [Alphaproteobacteria bacterium]